MKKIKEKNLLLVGGLALVGLLLYNRISSQSGGGNYNTTPYSGGNGNNGNNPNIDVNNIVNTAADFGKDVLDYFKGQNQPQTNGRTMLVVYKSILNSLNLALKKAAANGGVYTWVDENGVSRSMTTDEIKSKIETVERRIESLSK